MSAVTETPQRDDPWSRFYAEQGRERPQLIEFKRGMTAAPRSAETIAKSMWDEPPPEVELVNAARLAEIASEIEARRRRDRLAMLKVAGAAAGFVLAVVGLVEVWQFFGNGRVAPERLAAEAAAVSRGVVATHSTAAQPMVIEAVRTEERVGARAGRADYDVVVTLRLAENLFAPADSNGAQPYLLMQRSVNESADRMRRDRLFLDNPALADPVQMPRLLALAHRAGERLDVRVPLKSERVGFRWRLVPHPEQARLAGPAFGGQVLARWADEPHLIFGSSEAREKMRTLIADGRRYVLAVNAELGLRARRVVASAAAEQ
jgi:hypothetical protein